MTRALHDLLGPEAKAPLVQMPLRGLDIISGYACEGSWKLASVPPPGTPPRYIRRLSENPDGGEAKGYYMRLQTAVPVVGDTPLSSGVHAWRVTLEQILEDAEAWRGDDVYLGVMQAGGRADEDGYEATDTVYPFYGMFAEGSVRFVGTGMNDGEEGGGGLDALRPGDSVDFVLDVEGRTLTAVTPRTGKHCVISDLPAGQAWTPYFSISDPHMLFSCQAIRPEWAGKKG